MLTTGVWCSELVGCSCAVEFVGDGRVSLLVLTTGERYSELIGCSPLLCGVR